jgi:ABC-type Zn2+ transport system substrate-binding protein/surface adhesin
MKKANTKRGPLLRRRPLRTLEGGGFNSLGVAPRFKGVTLREAQEHQEEDKHQKEDHHEHMRKGRFNSSQIR